MRTHSTTRFLALLLAASLILAACGSDSSSPQTAGTGSPPAGDGTPGSGTPPPDRAPTEPMFPVTIEAENGPVELAAPPTRIVSLSASVTEVLFAIDAGDQVIAVDQHSNHPEGAPVTDLSGFRPNIEAIGGYEPDLVVAARDRDGLVDSLTSVGIPVILVTSPGDLATLYDHVSLLGAATGRNLEAQDLVDQMRSDLEALASSVPASRPPVPYYYELSDSHHSITTNSFIGEVLALAGLVSIGDGVGDAAGAYPQLSAEFVLAADPAIIFVAHAESADIDPATVGARPGWSDLSAVRDDRVMILDPDLASRWGPRVVDLLASVIAATADLRDE